MLVFGSLLALVAAVSAIPAPDIVRNSERLARNLPPLPPKFARALPGHARDATPAFVARAYPSAVPPVSYTGRIEVRHGKESLGYLENSKTSFGGINHASHEDALHVSIKTTATGTGPFEILALHPLWKGHDYLGASSSDSEPKLSAHSAETVEFAAIEKTPRNSLPVRVTGGHGESTIWSINPHTKELTAHWINPDNSKPSTVIGYDAHANKVFFSGDIDAYNKANPHPASAVKFYLAPDS